MALIWRGASVDLEPFFAAQIASALCALAAAGDVVSLEIMLRRGVSANFASSPGYTALMCAVDKNQLETACTLLEAGADVDAQASNNRHALGMAERKRNREMVELLVSYRGKLEK